MNSINKLNKTFMAFATGTQSSEGSSVKRYIGIAPVFVIGVNPTKVELEKIYETSLDKEPEYMGTSEVGPEGQKKTVKQVRLDFIVKTEAAKTNGIDMTTKISFFLKEENRFNRDLTKVQVIDEYGRTAWASVDDVQNKTIPHYANGPANITANFRPCYIGEDELTDFIKQYLNIPNPQNYVDGSWVDKTPAEMKQCICRFDNIPSFFKGDFSPLKDIISYQPNNKVKAMFGVKSTDDNRMYQDVYTQRFLKANMTNYTRLEKEMLDRKANGGYSMTEFAITPLKEYNVEATDLGSVAPVANPFGGTIAWGQ